VRERLAVARDHHEGTAVDVHGMYEPLLEPMKRTLSVSPTFILIVSVEG
jgi:hypothetical protein